ncbi:Ras-related protein ced-10 [Taenia crassiceps]|uniref:Ras-related protein ced-10 n=1 Tax=Taenia crassiceps TaxID=6207 RepID=A0ABR4Q7R2_9CEST
MTEIFVKCVVVGDGTVGKTCLILRYALGDLSSLGIYVPTVADTYSIKLRAGKFSILLNLWDTAGQQGYERLRQLSYPQTNIFLVCFAVNNTNSFENARDLWIPEVRHFCPDAQVLLVGTKVDERDVDGQLSCRSRQTICYSDGHQLARHLKVNGYVECSAITGEGVKTVFDTAIKLAVTSKKPLRRHACSIM